jgi:hypothetical protein
MAQGQFTKEEAQATLEAVDDMFKGFSRAKKLDYLGHLNDILLFLEAAKRAAPAEVKK